MNFVYINLQKYKNDYNLNIELRYIKGENENGNSTYKFGKF